MHILFLSRWFPYPASNGSKIRIYNLLRGLAREHKVTLMTFSAAEQRMLKSSPLHEICEQVHVFKWQEFNPKSGQQRQALLSTTPRSLVHNFSAEFADCLQAIVKTQNIDLIIASQLAVASYASYFGNTPAIFEEVELSLYSEKYTRATHLKTKLRRGLMWTKHRVYMRNLAAKFTCCTVASEQERRQLANILPRGSNISIIPNTLDLAPYEAYRSVRKRAQTLIFTGAFTYSVNHVAMRWFLQDVYAQIQWLHPKVNVRITGDHANLPLPEASHVVRTGFVDDICHEIAAATIAIVPLLHGGGTRLKILEAMALHTPVVSTSKGAEGLNCEHGKHLLIADTPAEFAAAVNSLLADEALRKRLTKNAHQLVRQQYNWAHVLPDYLALVARTAGVPASHAASATTQAASIQL